MTVTTQSNKTIALGDGVTTSFTFDFIGVSADDIAVIFTDADGVETTLNTTLYDITLTAALAGSLWGIGGTVDYPLSGSPIAVGTTLTIYRTLPLTQDVMLQGQASFGQTAQASEQGLDLLEMQLQQVAETQARAIVVPIVDVDAPDPLPAAALRAGKALTFDSTGQPTASDFPTGSVAISAAMIPVVEAASLAAARTAFGLGAMATEGIGAGLEDNGASAVRVKMTVQEVSTNQAIAAAAFLEQFLATGPINFTLARANTLWNGFGFFVSAITGAITCIIDSNDAFVGQSTGVALTIPAGASAFLATNAASAGKWLVRWLPQVNPQFQCQLTKSSTNLLLSRFAGANLFINGRNELIPASGPTLAPTALAAATLYYIYAYMNSGTMTLEASATAYAQSATWGHLIKSGDPTRTLVGLARTDGSTLWADSAAQRFVRSYYNDPGIALTNRLSANRTTTSSSFAELNSEIRIEFLNWTGETVQIEANGGATNNTTNDGVQTSLGIDGVTQEDTVAYGGLPSAGAFAGNVTCPFALALFKTGLTEGYHYATLLGAIVNGGTGAWVGSASVSTTPRCTLRGYAKR